MRFVLKIEMAEKKGSVSGCLEIKYLWGCSRTFIAHYFETNDGKMGSHDGSEFLCGCMHRLIPCWSVLWCKNRVLNFEKICTQTHVQAGWWRELHSYRGSTKICRGVGIRWAGMYDSEAYKPKREWHMADLKREPMLVAHMDLVWGSFIAVAEDWFDKYLLQKLGKVYDCLVAGVVYKYGTMRTWE